MALRAVSGLVEQYGRDSVFGWLTRGLPTEIVREVK